MNDFPSNSHKAKTERALSTSAPAEKKVEKVISGKAKAKQKSEVRKLTDIFISEDAANVKNYIFMDVLVPAIKKAISDIVRDGIDMILYGESGRRKSDSRNNASYVSYSSRYDDRNDRRNDNNRRQGYDYKDIYLDTKGEAEEVLDRMFELLEEYKMVSVADLYDLVGITANYTDNNYGWTNLQNAESVRTRDGYLIKLPNARPLK